MKLSPFAKSFVLVASALAYLSLLPACTRNYRVVQGPSLGNGQAYGLTSTLTSVSGEIEISVRVNETSGAGSAVATLLASQPVTQVFPISFQDQGSQRVYRSPSGDLVITLAFPSTARVSGDYPMHYSVILGGTTYQGDSSCHFVVGPAQSPGTGASGGGPGAGTAVGSYHGAGTLLTQLSNDANPSSRGNAMAIDSLGRLIVAGSANDPAGCFMNDFVVARYGSDGALDTSFNGTGKVASLISSHNLCNGPNASANALALDGSGNIVVAGYAMDASNNYNFAVARYTSSGALDTGFNGSGILLSQLSTASSPSSQANAVTIDGSGNIVVAGWARDPSGSLINDFAVARYTPSGALDTSFNGTGMVLTRLSPYSDNISSNSSANAIAIDGSGKIVVAGYVYNASATGAGHYNFAVVRYTSSGALDTSFNGSGMVFTQTSPVNDMSRANALAIGKSGNIVVAGVADDGSLFGYFAVARYTSSGALDTSFNGTGMLLSTASISTARAVAVDALERIVVAGSGTDGAGHSSFAVARYASSGTLDTSFAGGAGMLVQQVSPASLPDQTSQANAVAIDGTGRVIAVGSANDAAGKSCLAAVPLAP